MHSKPTTIINTNTGKSFIRIEEVNPNELNVKIEEVPLTIPQFNNTVNKGKLPRINIKKLTNDSTKKHNNNNNSAEITTSPVVSPQVCIQVKGNFKKIPHLKGKYCSILFYLLYLYLCVCVCMFVCV